MIKKYLKNTNIALIIDGSVISGRDKNTGW